MDVQWSHVSDWVRAATRAHMVLSQSLSDEELDELLSVEVAKEQVVVDPGRAA